MQFAEVNAQSLTGLKKAEIGQKFYLFQVDAWRWHRVGIVIQRCHFLRSDLWDG